MTASGASDGSGSGLAEYMYFVDNKAGKNDTIVRKTVGTDSNPHVASYTATMGRYLGQVAVADKAGNVSNVQGDPDARTKMYAYDFYNATRVEVFCKRDRYYWLGNV